MMKKYLFMVVFLLLVVSVSSGSDGLFGFDVVKKPNEVYYDCLNQANPVEAEVNSDKCGWESVNIEYNEVGVLSWYDESIGRKNCLRTLSRCDGGVCYFYCDLELWR